MGSSCWDDRLYSDWLGVAGLRSSSSMSCSWAGGGGVLLSSGGLARVLPCWSVKVRLVLCIVGVTSSMLLLLAVLVGVVGEALR